MITIFTPTYNRAHLLPRLYESICKQDCMDFEWLVIDDGSTDNTGELFDEWTRMEHPFPLIYKKVRNGGKQRAINEALDMARGEFFFIVDSDDALAFNAISFIKHAFSTLPKDDNSFIGISGLRVYFDGSFIHQQPKIESSVGYVDCNNIERPQYALQADMAEAFYTEKLKQYRFPVWEGENFTPEAVVWDQMALDGYRLRWFDVPIYYCEYQQGGLTDSTWSLLKRNPMGYAMLFNMQLKVNEYCSRVGNGFSKTLRWKIHTILQFVSSCCMAKQFSYISKCVSFWVYPFFFLGVVLSIRRYFQIYKYLG